MVESDVKSKIQALFDLREFPQLLQEGGLDETFRKKLIDLQMSIYELDAFLESNWVLDPDLRRNCWEKIYNQLSLCGITAYNMDEYCDDIYHYEEHEINIRKGISPSTIPIEQMYYYKSCDVKLLRRLIYDNANKTLGVPIQDWKTFDFITELMDDIEDLKEDLSTYNTNRIIFDIESNGVAKTIDSYKRFLILTKSEFESLSEPSKQYLRIRFEQNYNVLQNQFDTLLTDRLMIKTVKDAVVFQQFNQTT